MTTFQKYLVLMLHYKSLKGAKTWHDSVMRAHLISISYINMMNHILQIIDRKCLILSLYGRFSKICTIMFYKLNYRTACEMITSFKYF